MGSAAIETLTLGEDELSVCELEDVVGDGGQLTAIIAAYSFSLEYLNGWVAARDQLISIIEGTTPATTARGVASTFKHFPDANRDLLPGVRGFWLEFSTLRFIGPLTPSLPRRTRADLSILFVYDADDDVAALYEVIARDHLALSTRLLNPALW